MYKRSYRASSGRAGKSTKVSKRSFGDDCKRQLADQLHAQIGFSPAATSPSMSEASPKLNEDIITLVVGRDQRLFAAHENVLTRSPWFSHEISHGCAFKDLFSPNQRTVSLPHDDPQVISAVLEFLYKGDYFPRSLYDKRCNQSSLGDAPTEGTDPTTPQRSDAAFAPSMTEKKAAGFGELATIFHSAAGEHILRDTAVYCAAQRFGLPKLQRLALRKQGLQTGIDVATILRSARFAYANTSDSDSKLRAHYLALIIRNRKVFKQSGTMQMEMEKGGTQMFFDLFVALCHHIDDIAAEGPRHSS